MVVAVVLWLSATTGTTASAQNIPTGFDFLDQPAGFPIPASDFRQTQPVQDALVEGLLNTLRLSITGIVLATVLGTLIGIARLSQNFIVRSAARVYVEFVRNVPLLVLLVLRLPRHRAQRASRRRTTSWDARADRRAQRPRLERVLVRGRELEGRRRRRAGAARRCGLVARWRRGVADRTGRPARTGLWALAGGVVVLVVAWLVLGLGATAPELDGRRVTGGITMTPAYFAAAARARRLHGEPHRRDRPRLDPGGAARAGRGGRRPALSGFQRMWYVVLPQAMRIAVPPIGNQYLNLTKNSSLGRGRSASPS